MTINGSGGTIVSDEVGLNSVEGVLNVNDATIKANRIGIYNKATVLKLKNVKFDESCGIDIKLGEKYCGRCGNPVPDEKSGKDEKKTGKKNAKQNRSSGKKEKSGKNGKKGLFLPLGCELFIQTFHRRVKWLRRKAQRRNRLIRDLSG